MLAPLLLALLPQPFAPTAQPQDVEQLIAGLAQTEQREASRAALLELGKRAVGPLGKALGTVKGEHAWEIALLLRRLGRDASPAKARLQSVLKDADARADVRSCAAFALAGLGESGSSAVPLLIDALAADSRLAFEAAMALGAIGKPAASKLKKEILGNDPYAGILALAALHGTGEAAKAAQRELLELTTSNVFEEGHQHHFVLQRVATLSLRQLGVEYVDPDWLERTTREYFQGPDAPEIEVKVDGVVLTNTPRWGGVLDPALLEDSGPLRSLLVEALELREGSAAAAFACPEKLFDWSDDGDLTTGEALCSLARHLAVEIAFLQREVAGTPPTTYEAWTERTRRIEGLIAVLYAWTRPEVLERTLSLQPMFLKLEGFFVADQLRGR